MTILLIARHDNVSLSRQTFCALSAALMIEPEVDVLVAGYNAQSVAHAAAGLRGVGRVLLAEAEFFRYPLAERVADLVCSLFRNYDVILAADDPEGKSFMPRVAGFLGFAQVSGIIEVVASDVFKRLIYSGSAIQTVRVSDSKKVLTIRASSFSPALKNDYLAPIERVGLLPDFFALSSVIKNNMDSAGRPDLSSAKIVVSGGRALGSAENFCRFIFPLADKLGAGVGASRAAVDAGYAPNDWQIGQTGRIIAPDLYIACGISGAIQHIVGIQDSRKIIAINIDPEAPIFQVADYCLVGDLFTVLPELCASL